MSKGKHDKPVRFDLSRYNSAVKQKEDHDSIRLTDREICRRIEQLHIVISTDAYTGKDRIVTCTPQYLSNAKRKGELSPSILNAIGQVLGVAPEYLSGEIREQDLDFFTGTPQYSFHEYQEFLDLTPEQKEEYFKYELFDLHLYGRWVYMNNRQRSNCHQALIKFSDYLLSYMDRSEDGYKELFDFFEKTGVLMESDPDLRKELFNTLKVTYKTFMEMHKK